MSTLLDRKLEQDVMLRQIEDVLRGGRQDRPAYTLILGAGASFGAVPTAKQMLGIADGGSIHEDCIPAFLHERQHRAKPERSELPDVVRTFWDRFLNANPDLRSARTEKNKVIPPITRNAHGVPDSASIAEAYKSVFDQRRMSGMNTPAVARDYLRAITLRGGTENIVLNGTHFFLASLLSLQGRSKAVDGPPPYVGQRDFARTIFTTNFDPLLQVSLQLFHLLYYMTDRPESLAADGLHTDDHPAIHLFYAHGSVHRPFLANTEEEIEHLKTNARSLAAYLGEHGVIVLGYSGWDDCLLRALQESGRFAHNLYWLARGPDSISPEVEKFLCSRTNTFWVQITDGGEFMAALHRRLCPEMAASELLRNPIPFLRRRLSNVNLHGIDTVPVRTAVNFDVGETAGPAENAPSPEELRCQVVALLEESVHHFEGLCAVENDKIQLKRIAHQADLARTEKNWDKAVELFSKIIEHPHAPPDLRARACLRRAGICLQQEKYAAALADFGRVVDLPGVPVEHVVEALYKRGNHSNSQKQWLEAIADFSRLIDLPGAPAEHLISALIRRGLLYEGQGKHAEALVDYGRIVDRPDSPPEIIPVALLFRGISHLSLHMTAEALDDFNRLINYPGANGLPMAFGLMRRGGLYEKQRKLKNAIADYSRAIDLPDVSADTVSEALVSRGDCYGKQGKDAEKFADYARVIDLPGAPVARVGQVLLRRASWHGDQGRVAEAIADYSRVVELIGASADQVSEALVSRGFYYGRGNAEKRIADYTRAINLPGAPADNVALALVNRGIYFEETGDTVAAIADYSRAIDMADAPAESVADALINRGDCYREVGRMAEARADYRRALELPDASAEQVEEARRKMKTRRRRAKATDA